MSPVFENLIDRFYRNHVEKLKPVVTDEKAVARMPVHPYNMSICIKENSSKFF